MAEQRVGEFEIRKLREEDFEDYCKLRAEGLLDSPIAFTTSYNDFISRSDAKKREIFLSSIGIGTENFTLAAFVADDEAGEPNSFGSSKKTMIALTGFGRETREKALHKGSLVSVYVTPKYRGRGLSRMMMDQAMAFVRKIEGVQRDTRFFQVSMLGLTTLLVSCTAPQTTALNLYKSSGKG